MLNFLTMSMFKGKRTYTMMGIGAIIVVLNSLFPEFRDVMMTMGVKLDPTNWLQDIFVLGAGGTMRAGMGK